MTWNFWRLSRRRRKQCSLIYSTVKVNFTHSYKFKILNSFVTLDFEFKQAKEFWTSGTDLGNEGKFFFLSTGKTIGHLSWARDEPNNARRTTEIKSSSETENCMAYTMTENLKFYRLFDRFCSLKFYFICQDIQRRQIKSNMHKNCWINKIIKFREKTFRFIWFSKFRFFFLLYKNVRSVSTDTWNCLIVSTAN